MSSKFISALIILTVAALGAAAAFQYFEMESFGLPQTLKERFFSVKSAPADAPAEGSNQAEETANP